MKLEFLASGSPDCPLIRLYEFDLQGVTRLRKIFEDLSQGTLPVVTLHDEPGIESIDSCKLTLRSGNRDLGMLQKGLQQFECVLTPDTWDWVSELVGPFCEVPTDEYQWLSTRGKISLLLSHSGMW
jgi:hypothetical protein